MSVFALKLMLHTALCLVLMWTCFCRQVRSNSHTLESVRVAFWLLFVSAMVLLVAPIGHKLWPDTWPRYTIQWPMLALLASAALVQVITAKHWHRGPPAVFQRLPGGME